MDLVKLRAQLIVDEDLRLRPYVDSVGKLTIGVGRNLTDVGISKIEAMEMMENDIERAREFLSRYDWDPVNMNDVRQRVLTNMMFNMGPTKFSGFRKMISAVYNGDWDSAADEMLDSLWARQVGLRAHRLANQMRTGND